MKKGKKQLKKLTTEGWDQDEFLPEKWFNPATGKQEDYPRINASRNNKGDLEPYGKNSGKVKDVSVIQELIKRGFIEEHHRECAITLAELRYAMLNSLSYKINSRVLTDFVGGSISSQAVNSVLDSITRYLTLRRVRIIHYALNEPAIEDRAIETIAGISVYRECFEMLYDALKDAWKAASKENRGAM